MARPPHQLSIYDKQKLVAAGQTDSPFKHN